MFLPRATASSSSPKPDKKSAQTFQQSPKRYGLNKVGTGQGAAWSQPTTAPASVQVHYHYLAGRYRDLSNERGLGLSSSGMPSSSSTATLGGILEGERDEVNSIEGDARSINLQTSPNGKTPSASNSLRAIARKTGVGREAPSTTRLQDLFGIGVKDKRQNDSSPTKDNWKDKKREPLPEVASATHGTKHKSLRSYAEERIKAQEAIDSRIEEATDTGRLKWEARTAMLNSSFALAIHLYTRAAQLGSITAALSLSHLYATGLTRGNKPMVVLVYRDPLRSLSWVLEAAKLLQQRTSAREKKQGASTVWSRSEAEQPAQIVALLARLLRCKQAGLTAVSEVKLPTIKRRRSGKRIEHAALVWEAVCESMEWLDRQVASKGPSHQNDGRCIGPDDDEADLAVVKELRAHTQVALIEAIVALRRWAVAQLDEENALSQLQLGWRKFAEVLQSEGSAHDPSQGDLSMVRIASEKLLGRNEDARKELGEMVEALNESLTESRVPVASSSTAGTTFSHLESPPKRRAGQSARRRASLEELLPVDAHAKRSREQARRPSLLNHRSSGEAIQTSTLAYGTVAPVKRDEETRRSFSLQGKSKRPELTSSATMAQLEALTLHPRPKERGTLQRAGRPSSVMSASPSLLFTTKDEDLERPKAEITSNERQAEEENVSLSTTSSVVSSLWQAAPLQGRKPSRINPKRDRVVSLYGPASVATSEKVNTEGVSTFDYDVDIALSRQQTRRRRGDSNASISTIASMFSTSMSFSASVTGSEYAKGHFLSPSTSSNLNGFDFKGGGAADSLRRIRKASISSQTAPTAPHLTDTLEDLIANSASYRAANAKTSKSKPAARIRRDSNASMKSLTAFTGNNQRQTSYGDMRPTSLFQGRASSVLGVPTMCTDRGSAMRSPTLSLSTSYFNVTPQIVNGTMQAKPRAPSYSAVGSLRLLGRQFSSQSEPKATTLASTKVKHENDTIRPAKQNQTSFPSLGATAASTLMESPKPSITQRSFEAFDPTHSTSASKLHSQTVSPSGSIQNVNINGKSKSNSNNNSTNINHHNASVLDPALAEAEARSGLKTTSICIVCHSKVVNAPVSKSGDVYCSRDCRIEMKRKRASETKGKAKAPS